MLKRFKRIDLTQGSMELVGYMVCLPFLMTMVLALMSTVQISLARQTLEFAGYSATRAAVLSSSYELGKKRAETIMDAYIHGASEWGIEPVIRSINTNMNNVGETDCIDFYLLYIGDNPKYGKIQVDSTTGEYIIGSKYYKDMFNKYNHFVDSTSKTDEFMNIIWGESILIVEVSLQFNTVCPFLSTKTIGTQQIMKVG